ncbi:hypothetical protein PRIPAC_75968 [Pristionchus pacificus]|uniref:Uncharacterized protein n=1 Tax=Pristionchus pacificus TaxID=54126 RepID=A0A2A6BRH1_PRIPA|nr:hypothetical protein PRIPAC_75968 [Pristionchus pacificus]|eukprot:PDM68529.1 hypothetical protein PRIPAC_44031 [Pristionchus pacificus]
MAPRRSEFSIFVSSVQMHHENIKSREPSSMLAARLLLLVAVVHGAPASNKNFLLATFTCVEGGGAIRNEHLHENLDKKSQISVASVTGPWERRLKNGETHTFKVCNSPTDQTPNCGKWVDKNGKSHGSGVTVTDKGRMIILTHNKSVVADSGEYIVPSTNNRSFSVNIEVSKKR